MSLDVLSSGEPTYWPTDPQKIPDLIDFGIVKNISRETTQIESSFDLSSDHSPTIITLTNPLPSNVAVTGGKINWRQFRMYLSAHCTENITLRTAEDIDRSIDNFDESLKQAAEHAIIPPRQKRCTRIYSVDIEQLLTEKRRVRREWQVHRSPQLKLRLKECTKRLKQLLKSHKTASLENYLNSLDSTPQSDYSLWRATKYLKRPVICKPPLRTTNGRWARNDTEKGNLFVSHLKKVYTPHVSNGSFELPPFEAHVAAPIPLRFKIQDIEKAIVDLNPRKAPGMDKISNKMIMELPRVVIRIILFIFNAILRLNYYPAKWKVSLVTMIPKPGKDQTRVESYRPISLLPNLSKLFERLLLNKLIPILNENGCIPDHQFGFRRKHSTVEQTHRLVNVIRNTFEERKYCSALFIDVSQAFDKVWHEGLLYKIKQTLPINTYGLLESYLTGRKFRIKEGNFLSSPQPIEAGVPQGSILGPILYLIYTSDMPITSRVFTSTFADDTAFLSVHENPQEASQHLQEHIFRLERWIQRWRIKINEQKCIHITFTLRRETCPPVKINNQIIPQHEEAKYLGIHLDRRLTWNNHIIAKLTQMKLKAIQINWLIGRNSTLSLDCKLLLYNSIIKPIWCYGIQLWGTASASNIQKIQRRQNKILRMITAAPWYIRNSNIHKDLNVSFIKTEIAKHIASYLTKLESHPNPLARNILNNRGHIRLRRNDTTDMIQRR